MIHLKNVKKEFKIYKKDPGFIGAVKGLFSRKYEIKTAVKGLDLDINPGEIVGYIGANGAGKSTTIKIMTGILVPTAGSCMVNGLIAHKNRQKNAQNIGVVFGQRTQLWWDLPLIESFNVLKDMYEVSDKDFDEKLKFFDKVFEINSFINSPVRTLSLGQRMRADLAAALIHNPKILFLDEPTIGLDVVVKDKIRKAIKLINEKYNTTVLLTTHDLSDIEELCERIIIIDNGQKIYDGKIKEIKDKFGNYRTVEISVANVDLISEMNFAEIHNIDEKYISSWINNNSLFVKFDKNIMNISTILSDVMKLTEVLDLSITETDIETIVKQIYEHEVDIC